MTELEIQEKIDTINKQQSELIAKVKDLEIKKDKLKHTIPTKAKKTKRTSIASE